MPYGKGRRGVFIGSDKATNKDDYLRILQNIYTVILGFGLRSLVDATLPAARGLSPFKYQVPVDG